MTLWEGMKLRYLLPVLALAACGNYTPEARYYQLDQLYQASLRTAIAYTAECKALPADNPCRDTLPKLKVALETADTAFDQADRVFVTRDSAYYDLSLSVAENALNNLRAALTKEEPHE